MNPRSLKKGTLRLARLVWEPRWGRVCASLYRFSHSRAFVVAGVLLGIGLFTTGGFERISNTQVAAVKSAELHHFDALATACPSLIGWATETTSHPVVDAVVDASSEFEVESELVYAVIATESRCKHASRSSKGATGLMQLMPSTARWLGVRDLKNVRQNVRGGAKYLSILLRKFDGRLDLALAAYNAGPETVRRYGGIPPFRETERYVQQVSAYYAHLKALTSATKVTKA